MLKSVPVGPSRWWIKMNAMMCSYGSLLKVPGPAALKIVLMLKHPV